MNQVVVGIDFGSSITGYTYLYNNPKDIYLGQFPNQRVDSKVLTQIILDSDLEKVLDFGNECNKYITLMDYQKVNCFFKKIKMNIYEGFNFIKPQNN